MRELGHFGAIGPGFCIDSWGAGPFWIAVDGKSWTFEFSDRFGPLILDKRGSPADKQPKERSPFWRGLACWLHQGKRLVEGSNVCVWQEPRPTKVRRSGRMAIIVENGDDYWPITEVVGPITKADIEAMQARPDTGKGDRRA